MQAREEPRPEDGSTGGAPEREEGASSADGTDSGRGAPWLRVRVWAGAASAAALIVALVLWVPDVRAWFLFRIGYPVAARVLGRETIVVAGERVQAAPEPGVTMAFSAMVVLFLLALRAFLLTREKARWSRRVRLDTSFVLALLPYLALAPVLTTLAALQLFRVPWTFFAVPPLVVLLVVAIGVVSLGFAFWVEAGKRRQGPLRFLVSVGLFLFVGVFWIVALGGTTMGLRWWIVLATGLLVLGVQYSVTLGNRIHSHRRALFSLGYLHLVFFSSFLLLWSIGGPWPVQEWSFAGQEAVRDLRPHMHGTLLLALAVGPAVLIGVGAYTIGAFLHRYTAWAAVWVDGLSLLVLFAQVLEGWVVTLMVNNPYGALTYTVAAPGPLAAWALPRWGGWGYFAAKLVVAVVLVLVFSLPRGTRSRRGAEIRAVVLGAVAGLGLVPGLRHSLELAVGA